MNPIAGPRQPLQAPPQAGNPQLMALLALLGHGGVPPKPKKPQNMGPKPNLPSKPVLQRPSQMGGW